MSYLVILRPGVKKKIWCPSKNPIHEKYRRWILMNLLVILKSMLFLCSRHAITAACDNIIRRIIINNLCVLTLSQQIWELILSIIF
jgi:hypothetical protein